jgi:DNA topoisomerase-6 subunit B
MRCSVQVRAREKVARSSRKIVQQMPPKKADGGQVRIGQRGEVLRFKSPAEFFSENKNIAGFDNPGKSLYTTIRELVENSLDACESISVLPDIQIEVQELDGAELNKVLGIVSHERLDSALFEGSKGGKKKAPAPEGGLQEAAAEDAETGKKAGRAKKDEVMYYRVVVRDNGCGMKHENIPEMLGRVLAGSKYGVRQTRGKFGLGAKMALIWSKQSTGMPVEVRSATSPTKPFSACVLDIDIQKNEPRVRLHEQLENTSGMRGSELSLLVGGTWSSYRSYIVRYLRQMAVITPYARFRLSVSTKADKGTLQLEYARRSEEMPKPPSTIKHHPASVHAELLTALLKETREKLLSKFLAKDFSCIDPGLAGRMIAELRMATTMEVSNLEHKQIVQLAHLMRDAKFDAPSGDCLSPVGEYNLRLGIMKELRPELVATFQDAACCHEGHPLIIEAGVCLGGRDAKPGITVYRFANRIPLLFEGGADVATQVSKKRINWSAYKIRQNQDKVGVFVSLVSTKVPFKGTGKEYIGDDIPEVQAAVKRALERCCLQLKAKIVKQRSLADERERRKNLTKYIPDVSRAIHGILTLVQQEDDERADEGADAAGSASAKRPREHAELLLEVREKRLKEETLSEKLRAHIEQCDEASALEHVALAGNARPKQELYISAFDEASKQLPELHHPKFVLKMHEACLRMD